MWVENLAFFIDLLLGTPVMLFMSRC